MATFAKTSFSSASYASFRPTYPASLYSAILNYHRGPRKTCLDLGCGHGLVARALAPSFERVIASDPSPGMIKQAQSQTPTEQFPNVTIRQAAAEVGIGPFKDLVQHVDAVVSGQAAHWFDFDKTWPQLASAIRPGGTLAMWCYKDHVFVDYPMASEIFAHWINGSEEGQIGDYWEPGRALVRQNYAPIKPPEKFFEDEERILYEPATNGPGSGEGEVLLQKKMTIAASMSYLRTWSAVHNWQEAHGNPRARKDGGSEGDIVDRLYDQLRQVEESWDNDDLEVVVEWGTCLLLARRR